MFGQKNKKNISYAKFENRLLWIPLWKLRPVCASFLFFVFNFKIFENQIQFNFNFDFESWCKIEKKLHNQFSKSFLNFSHVSLTLKFCNLKKGQSNRLTIHDHRSWPLATINDCKCYWWSTTVASDRPTPLMTINNCDRGMTFATDDGQWWPWSLPVTNDCGRDWQPANAATTYDGYWWIVTTTIIGDRDKKWWLQSLITINDCD